MASFTTVTKFTTVQVHADHLCSPEAHLGIWPYPPPNAILVPPFLSPVENQPVEKPMDQQVIEEKQPCVEDGCVERPRFAFDLGADYEAEGGHFGQGDGAVALAWPLGPDCDGTAEQPLSIQTPLEPAPPCNQVRRK